MPSWTTKDLIRTVEIIYRYVHPGKVRKADATLELGRRVSGESAREEAQGRRSGRTIVWRQGSEKTIKQGEHRQRDKKNAGSVERKGANAQERERRATKKSEGFRK